MTRQRLMIPLLLALLSIPCLSQNQSLASNGTSPDLVIHLFRHGARAPLKDTYAPDWNAYELGQLTTIGQREHYLIGSALSDAYPDILGQPYSLSKIYLRSSTLLRSVESAEAQLYGVYEGKGPALNQNANYDPNRALPPFQSQFVTQKNSQLNNSQAIPGGFIPIPANTTSDEGGVTLLEPTQVCFNLIDNILENTLGDDAVKLWEDLEHTRSALDAAGLNVNNPYELGTLGDALVCDFYDGRNLPGNIDPTSEVYLNVTFARNWYFTQALWGAQQQRQLLSVPLYNYIFNFFDAKVAGTTEFEFMFLSTAETNLIDLLATLNILTPECLMDNYHAQLAGQPVPNPNCNYTEFASSIILEFYNNSGSPSVVFKYNNVTIPVCNNQDQCSYADFKNLIMQSTNNYTPDDYQRDCLGRTLPEIQTVLEKAGTAFQAQESGVKQDFDQIKNDLLGVTGNGSNSTTAGDNGNSGSIVDQAEGDVQNGINNATNAVEGKINQAENSVGNFLGNNNGN